MNESNNEQALNDTPVVYFTSDIGPEGLVAVHEKLGWNPTGKVAVKLSMGEPPASNYLRPELIKDLVRRLTARLWNATPLTAAPALKQRCTIKQQRITVLPMLPVFRFSMRLALWL